MQLDIGDDVGSFLHKSEPNKATYLLDDLVLVLSALLGGVVPHLDDLSRHEFASFPLLQLRMDLVHRHMVKLSGENADGPHCLEGSWRVEDVLKGFGRSAVR